MVNVVYEAGLKGNITAATWWLSHAHADQWGKRAVELSGGNRPLHVEAEAWLHRTVAQAKTVREVYDQADTIEKMRAVVAYDVQRRAEIRHQLAERNGMPLDDGAGDAE